MAVTLRQVAAAADVSIATVSLVLSGRGDRYRSETRDRVLAAAARLGYRPNASARFMQRGRFGIVGLLSPVDQRVGTLPHAVLEGAAAALEEHDLYLLLVRLDRTRLLAPSPPKALAERMTDGFLVNLHLRVQPTEEAAIDRLGAPCVWINHQRPGISVYPDDAGAGRDLARHMLATGHRRIAFADCIFGSDPVPEHPYLQLRRDGVEQACRAAGLTAEILLSDRWLHPPERVAWARAWLSRPERPTAVVTGNGETAGGILAAAAELGWAIPRDLSLATVSDYPVGLFGQPLATALVPTHEVGNRAARLLMSMLAGRADPALAGAVPCGFDPGASIRAPI